MTWCDAIDLQWRTCSRHIKKTLVMLGSSIFFCYLWLHEKMLFWWSFKLFPKWFTFWTIFDLSQLICCSKSKQSIDHVLKVDKCFDLLILKWSDAALKDLKAGSGGGSVGRAVASDSRGPWFESSHRQKFILNIYCQLYWKDENKEKEARNGPFLRSGGDPVTKISRVKLRYADLDSDLSILPGWKNSNSQSESCKPALPKFTWEIFYTASFPDISFQSKWNLSLRHVSYSCGFVYTFHPRPLVLSPKHTIYALLLEYQLTLYREKEAGVDRPKFKNKWFWTIWANGDPLIASSSMFN